MGKNGVAGPPPRNSHCQVQMGDSGGLMDWNVGVLLKQSREPVYTLGGQHIKSYDAFPVTLIPMVHVYLLFQIKQNKRNTKAAAHNKYNYLKIVSKAGMLGCK